MFRHRRTPRNNRDEQLTYIQELVYILICSIVKFEHQILISFTNTSVFYVSSSTNIFANGLVHLFWLFVV